jgi:hypothetical protein
MNNMAIVIHHLPYGDYIYDHHRVGSKIVTTYIGKVGSVRVVGKIPAKGYPINQKDWKYAHAQAQEAEAKEYGDNKFYALEQSIKKKIPKGELAGSNTPEGKLIAHKKLNPDEQRQTLYHEKVEMEILTGKKEEEP